METSQSQIADLLLRQEITKRLIANIGGSKIYAVTSAWEIDNVRKTAVIAKDLEQFEKVFISAETTSVFVPKSSQLTWECLKPVIKSSSQIKTIFLEN